MIYNCQVAMRIRRRGESFVLKSVERYGTGQSRGWESMIANRHRMIV
jgi:hypothetical protein